jgi:hypothetical protein
MPHPLRRDIEALIKDEMLEAMRPTSEPLDDLRAHSKFRGG